MKDLKQKALITVLASAMFMTACSTTATEAPETTAAPTESTTTPTEATTEATTTTTQETTEATTVPTYTDDMLPMTINEVADSVLKAMGTDYVIFDEFNPDNENYIDPKSYYEKNQSVGIVNLIGLGRVLYHETVDEDEEFNTIFVYVYIAEFDMDSEEYLNLADNGEFVFYFGRDNLYEVSKSVTAINKQYVMSIYAVLGNDYTVDYSNCVEEEEPPFTIGKAQEAYEAFVALE